MEKHIATATVKEFFTWYAGSDWKLDSQITNTMSIDNVHAQDHCSEGEVMKELSRLENEVIEITSFITPDSSAWDIKFLLEKKRYEIQSTECFRNDLSYSLN